MQAVGKCAIFLTIKIDKRRLEYDRLMPSIPDRGQTPRPSSRCLAVLHILIFSCEKAHQYSSSPSCFLCGCKQYHSRVLFIFSFFNFVFICFNLFTSQGLFPCLIPPSSRRLLSCPPSPCFYRVPLHPLPPSQPRLPYTRASIKPS